MIKLVGLGIIAFALLTEGHLPSSVLGEWKVGKPYDVGQPIGLDAKQEEMITGLVIKLSQDQIGVCGKEVPIKSVEVEHLTNDEFLAKYNFTPNLIGLKGAGVIDISLNKLHTTKACGEFADPGSHLFLSKSHAVVEVGNDYFPLTRWRVALIPNSLSWKDSL
jgi:hypothetical protein